MTKQSPTAHLQKTHQRSTGRSLEAKPPCVSSRETHLHQGKDNEDAGYDLYKRTFTCKKKRKKHDQHNNFFNVKIKWNYSL